MSLIEISITTNDEVSIPIYLGNNLSDFNHFDSSKCQVAELIHTGDSVAIVPEVPMSNKWSMETYKLLKDTAKSVNIDTINNGGLPYRFIAIIED